MNTMDVKGCFESMSLPVRYANGVGPRISMLLAKKGVHTIEDLLYFIPRSYEDRRQTDRIAAIKEDKKATIVGEVLKASVAYYRKAKVFEVHVDDGSGELTAKWFRGRYAYLKQAFEPGRKIVFSGEVKVSAFGKEMSHPDFELIDESIDGENLHFGRIVPIYSETEGLRQKNMRKIIRQALARYSRCVISPVPDDVCRRRKLMEFHAALNDVHFPETAGSDIPYNESRSPGHRRLIFDDFFFFELAMAMKKGIHSRSRGISFAQKDDLPEKFVKTLPFVLTGAQRRVIREIDMDMASEQPMQRLLQGDVGCGKTAVAMFALVRAAENGYQGAVMSPTEILAAQHYVSIMRWAEPLSLKVGLLTGSLSAKTKQDTLDKMRSAQLDIVIGTHALIQESVSFKKLGLVIIDEQHRFGVLQRQKIALKGPEPDVLVLTATPIPRTLSMTVYGDLDVSFIDEMPPGRKHVRTKIFYESERARVYEIVRSEVSKGNQAFVVYPLVAESEALDMKDATRMAAHLQHDIFPSFSVGLVHGRMKGSEKEKIMSDFSRGRLNILVSTTVVEVGIDVPQASLMVIEHAERFGLSQLHQMRGRVGRGNTPSYCILLTPLKGSEASTRRLRIMEETNDGFKIAEEDLKIRGPGELMGTRQSGLPHFRIADILRDSRILIEAREEAFMILGKDPDLASEENTPLKEVMMRRWGGRLGYAKTG